MAIAPGQLAHVQRHAARVDQALEEVLHQLCVKGANALRGDVQVKAEVRPPRQVLCAGGPAWQSVPIGAVKASTYGAACQEVPGVTGQRLQVTICGCAAATGQRDSMQDIE